MTPSTPVGGKQAKPTKPMKQAKSGPAKPANGHPQPLSANSKKDQTKNNDAVNKSPKTPGTERKKPRGSEVKPSLPNSNADGQGAAAAPPLGADDKEVSQYVETRPINIFLELVYCISVNT